MDGQDMITGGEFGRFRADFTAYQGRMVQQLQTGFDGVHSRLDELNSRTMKNSEGIVHLETQIGRLDTVETAVSKIQTSGCAAFDMHRALMTPAEVIEEDRPKWPQRRQVIAGGGLLGAGALIIKAFEVLWPHLGK